MKKLILLMFLAGSAFQVSAQNPAKIQFENEVIEFGTVQQDSDGKREFKFTNTGKEPLIISAVTSSCGCLIASGPKDPIAPGKSGVIKIQYDTKRVGRFEKMITVVSNDASRPSLVLKVKGEVTAAK